MPDHDLKEAGRIAVLGLHLEANSFAPDTVRRDFEQQCWVTGEEISRLARTVSHLPPEVPGFYARMDARARWTPVPVIIAAAPPGGKLHQPVMDEFMGVVRAGLRAALPLDGVCVISHGACVATADQDPDGTLLAAVREIVGPDVPVVVTHDLHCNVSERLVSAADCLIAFRTNPHVDQRERGAEAADVLLEMRGGQRMERAFIRLPMTPPTVTMLTDSGPYADLIRAGEAAMQKPGEGPVVNVSVTGGFVVSDVPKCGMTVNVTARGDRDAAWRVALDLARRAWTDRHRFTRKLLSVAEAVELARTSPRPVILSDSGDNPGGGGRGSTAYLLRALHEARVPGVVLGVFIDPDLAAEMHKAGEGAEIQAVFNRVESEFSKRFEARARVVRLSDGTGTGRRGSGAGRRFNLGPAGLLRLEGSGLQVVVGSLRRQLSEPRMLEMHGIDIAAARCVVVKSRAHFRAGFDEFFTPDRIFEVDTPGLTSPVLSNFAFRHLPRPVWPLDPDTVWTEPAPGGAG